MNRWALTNRNGFTIVELLIVIVVIAILAAVTLVAYNGIKDRAQASVIQSTLSQTNKKIIEYSVMNTNNYPNSLSDIGITNSASTVYQYTVDNSSNPKQYALSATNGVNGTTTYYIASDQSSPKPGIAPGQNVVFWYKDIADAPLPLNGGVVVTNVAATTGSKSIRIGPNTTGVEVRGTPFTVVAGQTYTVSFSLLTDSTWDGTSNNSKVRFADRNGLLKACGYAGPKTSWTDVTCSYTATSDIAGFVVSVGNNGSTGNIWLDNISLSIN